MNKFGNRTYVFVMRCQWIKNHPPIPFIMDTPLLPSSCKPYNRIEISDGCAKLKFLSTFKLALKNKKIHYLGSILPINIKNGLYDSSKLTDAQQISAEIVLFSTKTPVILLQAPLISLKSSVILSQVVAFLFPVAAILSQAASFSFPAAVISFQVVPFSFSAAAISFRVAPFSFSAAVISFQAASFSFSAAVISFQVASFSFSAAVMSFQVASFSFSAAPFSFPIVSMSFEVSPLIGFISGFGVGAAKFVSLTNKGGPLWFIELKKLK